MARFGPPAPLAVGVSGGPDSLALALLLRRWSQPLAIVVDHGLRPASGAETALTLRRLAAIGIPARTARLELRSGPALGTRARAARYAALFRICAAEGLADLVVAHHAQDQAETHLLRARAGSGPAGLAAMPALAYHGAARLLRPLLPIDPARLRATLATAGIGWVEDPTNTDPATARGALRAAPIPRTLAQAEGRQRHDAEIALAAELAGRVAIYAAGYAEIVGPLSPEAWSALLWTLSGRTYPPNPAATARLAQRGAGTLHGIAVRNGLAARESEAPAIAAEAGSVWDGRFTPHRSLRGATLGALGAEAAALRRRPGLPGRVLRMPPGAAH